MPIGPCEIFCQLGASPIDRLDGRAMAKLLPPPYLPLLLLN